MIRNAFIGLDLSLTGTGLSVLIEERFSISTLKTKLKGPQRLAWLEREIDEAVSPHAVSCIAIEGYSMGSKGRTFDLGELGGVVRLWAMKKGYLTIIIPPTSLKKYTTGAGAPSKLVPDPKERIREMMSALIGYDVKDDNQTDAMALSLVARDYTKARALGKALLFDAVQLPWEPVNPGSLVLRKRPDIKLLDKNSVKG